MKNLKTNTDRILTAAALPKVNPDQMDHVRLQQVHVPPGGLLHLDSTKPRDIMWSLITSKEILQRERNFCLHELNIVLLSVLACMDLQVLTLRS